MTIPKRRGRKKKILTKEQKLAWLAANKNDKTAGRKPKMWKEFIGTISEDILNAVILACYQVFLTAPKGQEHLPPNKRWIVLQLPYNFRELYGRSFPNGRHEGKSDCGWFVYYRICASRLYDWLHEKGLAPLPRSEFHRTVMKARQELIEIEKSISHLVPVNVREKIEDKVKENNLKKGLDKEKTEE